MVIDGQAYVTALDITNHPEIGLDLNKLTDELQVLCRDGGENRLKYAIHRALIMDTRPQFSPFQWTPSSGHWVHAHFSVMNDRRLLDPRPWNLPMLAGTGAPAPTPTPAPSPSVPGWPLPAGHWFGDWRGPNEQHGGAPGSQYDWERPHVLAIQRKLQAIGCAPNVPGWADGRWDPPTTAAMSEFQRRHRANQTTIWGKCYSDDWQHLFSL
ncbi:peptidoglycan-binding protein [Lentzea sp. JNUCC 0626]|uniref:peptidoglycan-binding domain-containing protein n=1 Tax=Lentzea sp. JNUCC 0626 TaxID=3367513 RepID=UPI00374794D8